MGASEWGFPLEKNVRQDVARERAEYGHRAELVLDVLAPGADDLPDVLPYARDHDLVVLTKDFSDVSAAPPENHAGVILVVQHTYSPERLRPPWTRISEPTLLGSRSEIARSISTSGCEGALHPVAALGDAPDRLASAHKL